MNDRERSELPSLRRLLAGVCGHSVFKTRCFVLGRACLDRNMTNTSDSALIEAARARAEATGLPGAAIELPDGSVISGKTTGAMNALATTVLKALRQLGGLDESQHIVPNSVVDPLLEFKRDYLGGADALLNLREGLMALATAAADDAGRRHALAQLRQLRGCAVCVTGAVNHADKKTLTSLGLNLIEG